MKSTTRIFKFTVIPITVFGMFFISCKNDEEEVEPTGDYTIGEFAEGGLAIAFF